MAQHNETGRQGEELAAEYLIKKGYTIRDTNWRWMKYELDATSLSLILWPSRTA